MGTEAYAHKFTCSGSHTSTLPLVNGQQTLSCWSYLVRNRLRCLRFQITSSFSPSTTISSSLLPPAGNPSSRKQQHSVTNVLPYPSAPSWPFDSLSLPTHPSSLFPSSCCHRAAKCTGRHRIRNWKHPTTRPSTSPPNPSFWRLCTRESLPASPRTGQARTATQAARLSAQLSGPRQPALPASCIPHKRTALESRPCPRFGRRSWF